MWGGGAYTLSELSLVKFVERSTMGIMGEASILNIQILAQITCAIEYIH